MQPILLYAELLPHIKQLSILVRLAYPSNQQTNVHLSTDGLSITVSHNGHTSTLDLPCRVRSDSSIKLPDVSSSELSFRCSIEDSTESARSDAPWACSLASDLTSRTQIACRSCSTIIVDGTISSWKDPPSENWAEMMDFWHCHKPDTKADGQDHSTSLDKGYAAARSIIAQPSFAFVDTLYFRVHPSDCSNVEVS